MIIDNAHTLLTKPGKKSMEEREKTAGSVVQTLYYEFLCLEQAGERAHNRFNKGQTIFGNIQCAEKDILKL